MLPRATKMRFMPFNIAGGQNSISSNAWCRGIYFVDRIGSNETCHGIPYVV